jgi:hypothetical protein
VVKGRAEITISQPQERVYDFIVKDFPTNYRRWSPEVQKLEMLTSGPLRVGTQARQVRLDQGRRSDTVFKVVALEPPGRICFAERSNKFHSEYRFDSLGEQTRLCFSFTLTRLELYMRPFEKLIRIAVQEGADRVVRNIKTLIEKDTIRT